MSTHPNTKHGYFGTPTYNSWWAMRQRCEYEKSIEYPRYGARGVQVCERWKAFENFLADVGERPPGMTLDRFPNRDGNYEPGNVRWASKKAQANNTRANHYIEFEGRTLTASEWAAENGVPASVIIKRISRGWSATDAITKPVGTQLLLNPGGMETQFKPKLIEFNGRSLSISEWAKEADLANASVLSKRLRAGWSLERALQSGPSRPRPRKASTQ